MWKERKKQKEKKAFGKSLNYGLRLITSLLVVSFWALSPLVALPWRAVNKIELKNQIQTESNYTKSSQGNSLKNSEQVKTQLLNPQSKAEKVLIDVDSLLENTFKELTETSIELENQKKITVLLESENTKIHQELKTTIDNKNDLVIENRKLDKECYGTKLITQISGLYNLKTGFGVEGAIGLRMGPGAIIMGGVSVPLSVTMNPPQLMNLENYTFKATLGWEW